MVLLQDVEFRWPGRALPCIKALSLEVAAGESVFIEGRSGSGKSTLLNLVTGLLAPQRGRIVVAGVELQGLGQAARDRFRAARIGLVFQQFNLVPWLDVESNLRLAASFGPDPRRAMTRIGPLLDALQLEQHLRKQRAAELSVGQQQRVAVARALINEAQLLVADEPTSALDTEARAAFITLLLQVQRERGATVLFVSHDPALAQYFERRVSMQQLNAAALTGSTQHVA